MTGSSDAASVRGARPGPGRASPRIALPDDAATLPPRALARAVLDEIAPRLPGRWTRSGDRLVRREAVQTTELLMDRSFAGRTGLGTWLTPRLRVRDSRLRRWCRTHGREGHPLSDVVYDSLLVNVSTAGSVEIAVDPAADGPLVEGALTPGEFVEALRVEVWPNRELLRAPGGLDGLPDRWLWTVESLLRWCVALGEEWRCWPLVDRSLAGRNPLVRAGFVEAYAQAVAGVALPRTSVQNDLAVALADLGAGVGPAPDWARPGDVGRSRTGDPERDHR